jgi:AraC-like DNA-binding protein
MHAPTALSEAELDSRAIRRSYDRLDVARLAAGRWTLSTAAASDSAAWPFLVFYPIAGAATVCQGPETFTIDRGGFLILSNLPGLDTKAVAETDLLVIRIPESTAGPYAQSMAAAHGRTISTLNGTASLVAHLFNGVAAQPVDYLPENPGRIDGGGTEGTGRLTMLQGAKEYIEVHLGDLDLSPDAVAAAQNISTRTLHRLFESEGLTISGWTRNRRLEHCRVELGDGAFDNLSVSSIGARWGLWDAAHFSRLFKSAFGESPRAYRATAAARRGESTLSRSHALQLETA